MGSNISALLKPVVRANGSELEIPHSMIGKSRLQVRRLSELEAMINKVEDDDVRIMLQKIYDHPLTENVGLQSDLLRHLCGMLDRGKLNVYIDIDDLTRALTSEVLQLEKYQHLSDTDIGNMSESDRARLLIDAIGSSQLNEKQRTKNIPITPLILHQGHITMGLENSIQGQVPGHRRGLKVARHMLLAMNSGVYTGERPNVLELRAETPIYRKTYRDALNIISELTQLSGNTPNEKMDNDYYTAYIAKLSTMEGINSVEVNQHLIDHFRLAESVRQIVSELQHDIDQLAAQVNAGEMGDDETTQTLKKIAGRAMIFNHCMHIITGLVNVSTYLSQVSSNSKLKGKKGDLPIVGFYRLFKQVSGADPYQGTTYSWHGMITINCDIYDEHYELNNAEMAESFSAIRGMVLKRLNGGYQV